MLSYTELLRKVEEEIASSSFNGQPGELYDPITYTLSMGGKRMRPVMALMACELFGGDIQKALSPAIACEVFHNFTLLHDDIMDKAPLRRGKETVYSKWNTNIAILSGDAMFAIAYRFLTSVKAETLPEILGIFSKTAIEVCEGQQYDMNFETQEEVSIEDYLNMIRLKTAVLPAACLKIGAVVAGATQQDAANIYAFGENIGLAFQLKDDLLDTFGDEAKFGKHCGGDIITNKKTFLYLKALEFANEKERSLLKHYFSGTKFNDSEKISQVKKIYVDLGIPKHVEAAMEYYYKQGIKNLELINVLPERKASLMAFAEKLLKREN